MATNAIQKVDNPYGVTANADGNALATIAAGASSAEVQIAKAKAQAESFAMVMAAKQWPRNEAKAAEKLITACQRPKLAEQAVYTYARGGQDISGPSIRLAEAAARAWGNMKDGIRITASDKLHSEVTAFAYDIEANLLQEMSFTVSHIRHTKKGDTLLTDPRDIYEKIANEGARRKRACILACMPGDVIDAAVEQCEQTLKATADISPATIQKLVSAFAEYGVTKSQIVAKIQRNLDAITPAQVVSLRKIFVSLKDGMAKPEDFFDQSIIEAKAEVKNVTPKPKKQTLAEKAAAAAAKAEEEEPAEDYPAPPADRQPPSDLPYTEEVEDIPDTL